MQQQQDVVAAALELAQPRLLGPRRLVEPQAHGLQAELGQDAGVNRIGFGQRATILGVGADARAMGLVASDAEFDADVEHMALVAASGFAHHQHAAELFRGVALQLAFEQPTPATGTVGEGAVCAAGQAVHTECLLGDLERDHMIEVGLSRDHSGECHLSILDCMRPSEALLPFGWPG